MAIISQLNTANTFSQWLTATQDLITKTNSLVEGGGSSIFYSNTNLSVANNLTIGGDLTVSGNIILDAISFDDINSNGSASFANNLSVGGQTTLTGNVAMSGVLSVTGNTTLTNLAVSGSANISTLTSTSGLLTSRTNIFVDGWALSSNANVRTGVTTFAVTNSGSGAYVFDQYSGNNPDIYLHPGQTVSFNINASGHPFLIRQSNGGTLYNVGLTHVSTTGVVTTESDAQAKESGTLIWKVPFALTGNTYVYQCQVHSGMVGNLIIQSTVTAALAAATSATGDSLAFAIALG
jgi:plastocyanin